MCYMLESIHKARCSLEFFRHPPSPQQLEGSFYFDFSFPMSTKIELNAY